MLFFGSHTATDTGVVDALVDCVDGRRVLIRRNDHTDPQRRLGALTALFSTVDEAEAATLPPEHRRLLTESIFRSPAAAVPSAAVLGPAVLSLLRALSRSTPPLLVVEAVHRLDDDTRCVLEYMAEEARGSLVRMIAVEEVPGPGGPRGYAICPSPLVIIGLGPSFGSLSPN
ncbi:hypothetical protein Vau01_122360 [Virgisporangium aurantiacum]|uniref:Uncharacterized protein n=1 Tax=Virgisporangium aurantiacum TaxID=175570 RepID=A0A8J4E736_9ACTN|nr:hypothetical protein Vau01_122360 [Virgisporangium aurantiacum]